MSCAVSIIIPVYNAEAYLAPCIESLLRQTLKACEFIFIDDGSRDNSSALIEKYRMQDGRIQLIRQANQGVSAARNAGLQRAKGEYIGFVDADDDIEPDMYETLYAAAKREDCDVVISNFECEMEGRTRVTRYPFPVETVLEREYIERELLLYFLKAENLNSVWNKLYRRSLILEHDVSFPRGVALGEDELFNLSFFSHAGRTVYLDYTGYHYKEVIGSATRNIMEKDYFSRALEVYQYELPEIFTRQFRQNEIQRLKSLRLIKSVMSYIYIYFMPSQEVSFRQRYAYVKRMINNPCVRDALPAYVEEQHAHAGRYERFITFLMKSKLVLGLYCATWYSRSKNKQTGGVTI